MTLGQIGKVITLISRHIDSLLNLSPPVSSVATSAVGLRDFVQQEFVNSPPETLKVETRVGTMLTEVS